MNIVEPILFQARFQPEAPALCALGDDVVSYARLAAQMNNIARRAMSAGLKRGSVVALSIDNQLLHAVVILGLTQVGIIPMSVAMQKAPPGLKIDAVIKNTSYPFAPEVQHLPLDFSWIMGDGAPIETPANSGITGTEVCRIILTSGTTGDPKAVALTHKLAFARNARYEHVLGNRYPRLSRGYMNMALASVRGYQFLTYMLGRGGTIFFRAPSVEHTLRSFEMFQIEAMVATPATLVQLLENYDQFPAIEFQFDTIYTGGSHLSQALMERVRPRLCAHLFTGYGSTEAAVVAMAPAQRIAHIPGAVGYLVPGIQVEMVDPSGLRLPAGEEGIVRISSEFAMDRYIDDPEASAEFFRDGWFYPGDVGSLTPDNLLIISGRQNDVLNVGGAKMAAERVEAVLASFDGVREAAVFVATSKLGVEEVWAAVVCIGKLDIEALRVHCRPQMPPVIVPAHVVTLDALPVNDRGKVDRTRVKEIVTAAAPS
jgi:acyl-CoA synthetase (AMP-forming)/AMP-acid ligase II